MKTNAKITELEKALELVNKKYAGNIMFKSLNPNGKRVNFTLQVKSSKEPGHRRGFSGQRMISACWHAHGDFFEALFKVNPEAWVQPGGSQKIDKNGGNWIDRNIGSMVQPLYFSEACDCGR